STRALVDTNIVVYAYATDDPAKHAIARSLLRSLSDTNLLVFSTQVLNEFCSTMLRPTRTPPWSISEVALVVRELAATGEVMPHTAAITLRALEAMPPHGLSFWDALIWAAARENGVGVIYTEDFQHGRDIEGVRFVNPFVSPP